MKKDPKTLCCRDMTQSFLSNNSYTKKGWKKSSNIAVFLVEQE